MQLLAAVVVMLIGNAGLASNAGAWAAAPQDPEPAAGANTQTFRKLADAAALPSARNHPFVKVWTGNWSRVGNEDPQPMFSFGLLLHDDGKRFRVLGERFHEISYQRTPKETDARLQVKYAPSDPLPKMRERSASEPGWNSVVDLYYGWLADGLGQPALAETLFDRVEQTRMHRTKGNSFATAAGIDLGMTRYEDLVLSFEQASMQDEERLRKLDLWLRAFPSHELAAQATDLREALARSMQRELADDATDIDRYVHQLTTTETGISIDGGWPFVLPMRGGERPADRLFELGMSAVPALVRALDDDRPSRSIRIPGIRSPGSHVVRVNRIATQILGAIAGLNITQVEPAAAKPEISAWLERVATLGYVEELVDRARTGDQRACQRLLDVAPDRLGAAVQVAMTRDLSAYQRKHLLRLVAQTESAAARLLLHDALESNDGAAIANVATKLLARPDQRARVLPALHRALRTAKPGSRSTEAIVALLCAHGTVESLDLLAELPGHVTGPELARLPSSESFADRGAGYEQALQDLLLAFVHHEHGEQTVYDGVLDPRLCDFAAAELAARWPHRYAFERHALRADRDRQLQALRGGPEAGPSLPATEPKLAASIDQHLADWHRTNLPSQRERILQRITEPAALPLLRATRLTVYKKRRAELDAACSRLAATVVSIGPDAELRRLAKATRDRLLALESQPLDPRKLQAFLSSLVAAPTDGVRIHQIEVLRASDDSGVRIQLRSEPGAQPIRERPQYRIAFAFDGEVLQDTTGAGLRDAIRERAFAKWIEHLTTALDKPDRRLEGGKGFVSPALEARVELRQRQ